MRAFNRCNASIESFKRCAATWAARHFQREEFQGRPRVSQVLRISDSALSKIASFILFLRLKNCPVGALPDLRVMLQLCCVQSPLVNKNPMKHNKNERDMMRH